MSAFIRYTPVSLGGGGGGGGGSTLTMGTYDGQTHSADGATITTDQLFLQSATAVFPGLVIVGNITDAGTDGIVITGGTGSIVGSGVAIAQHVADSTHNGYLSSADWSTFNSKQAALTIGNITDGGTDGIVITGGTGAIIGSGVALAQHVADSTHNGYLSSTDWSTFNSKQATVSIGNFDTTPNTKGLSLVAAAISLAAADGTHPGGLSAAAQTIGGAKTFADGILTSAITGSTGITFDTTSSSNLTFKTNGNNCLNLSGVDQKASFLGAININVLTASQAVVTDSLKNLTSLGYASANTVSTLVQRDGAGNFSAGTLTLVGALISGLTASQAVVTDGSKNLASLGYATAATATTLAERDGSANLSVNNHLDGYTTTATAAGTTTLVVGSTRQQYFTGSSTQTVQLPVASTLVLGMQFQIVNLSTGLVTINSSGANNVQILVASSSATVTCILTSGTTAASWSVVYNSVLVGAAQPPTVQKFTSSSGTYTTPTSPAPLYIRVRMVGGGGGGGGSGTTSGTAATDGGDTTFGSATAGKGLKGARGADAGAGGTATLGYVGTALPGGAGGGGAAGPSVATAASPYVPGGMGGSSAFGGAGSGGSSSSGAGGNAGTNTGGGGGGGYMNVSVNSAPSGSGGGSGAYVDAIITSPSATYSYGVGVGGSGQAAGTSGSAGGAGGSGYIEVTEYYSSFVSGAGNYTADTFSGNAATTAFTLSVAPATVNNAQVYISGVYQAKSTYTLSGTTITFSAAPPTGTSNIQVVTGTSVTINTPAAGSVVAASFASGTGATVTQSNPGVVKSAGQLLGTNTNDNAAAGYVGEFISGNPSPAVTPAANGVAKTITSISLTAGDWDVQGVSAWILSSATAVVQLWSAISMTTNAVDSTASGGSGIISSATTSNAYITTGLRRISVSGTTTVYLVGTAAYTTLGSATWGTDSFISARRVR